MKFTVSSGSIRATDPCYGTDTWCAGTIENVLNGEWRGSASISDEGVWGERVSSLYAIHSDYYCETLNWKKLDMSAGVDSGQFGFFDLQYFLDHEDEREYGVEGFYKDCCDQTYSETDRNQRAGVVGNAGVVSSSGFGDGSYDVFAATNEDGVVVALRVDYITDDETEDEEYDEYNDFYAEDKEEEEV